MVFSTAGGDKMAIKKGKQPSSFNNGSHSFAINLMEHLVVPTFVLDANSRVLIWNLACERLTGVPASEVIGTSDHWKALYDEPRPCLADLVVQGRTGEIKALYAEYEQDPDARLGVRVENWCSMPRMGNRLYLAMDAGPIHNDAGELIAVVETLRDMTVQKKAQIELERLASSDGLTGLANRRSFDETLDAEWNSAVLTGQPVALLMIDVDYFKPFNDTYGHQEGDKCLKRIAQAMAGPKRRADELVARYGGEEFSIILPSTSIAGARKVAERIRDAVDKLKIPHAARPDGLSHVTISIGVASTGIFTPENRVRLITSADASLYEAKRQGRNCIVAVDVDTDQIIASNQ